MQRIVLNALAAWLWLSPALAAAALHAEMYGTNADIPINTTGQFKAVVSNTEAGSLAVEITVTIAANYRIDGVAGAASCSVSGNIVSCPSVPIASAAQKSVFVDVTAITDGNGVESRVSTTDHSTLTASDPVYTTVTVAAPFAEPGAHRTVISGNTVTLDGRASHDPDGIVVSYHWEQQAGTDVTGQAGWDSSAALLSFVAPDVASTEVLKFDLAVTDDSGLTGRKYVDITVVSSNSPPVADAGTDFRASSGTSAVLDGRGSYDPDGHAITYNWSQTAGMPATLVPTGFAGVVEFAVPDVPAGGDTLVFKLIVTDSLGAVAWDEVRALVSPENRAPTADAGPDQSVTAGQRVQLDGSRSRDPDGLRLSYAWAQESGPAVELHDRRSVRPYFTAPEASQPVDLEFSLTVTDADGARDRDRVRIRVDAVNEPPAAGSLSLRTAADTPLALQLPGVDPEGGPLRFEVQPPVHGSLNGEPPALTYTPGTHYVGSDSFGYRVSDGLLSAEGRVTIEVLAEPLQLTGGTLPQARAGSAYRVEVPLSGAVGAVRLEAGGELPPGLALDGGAILGTPTAEGRFEFTLTATDSARPEPRRSSAAFALSVAAPMAVLPRALDHAVVGAPYAVDFSGRGGLPPYTVEVAGAVPGLALAGTTLKGVPEEPGDFTLRVRVHDAGEPPLRATAGYTLRVYPEGLAVVTGALPDAVVGAGYAAGLEARGGRPPYRWRALAGLPEGLELTTTGMLSGVPAAAGDHAVSVAVEDRGGDAQAVDLALHVAERGLIALTDRLPAGAAGAGAGGIAYGPVPLRVAGGQPPYHCEIVQGVLPPGIALNGCTPPGHAGAEAVAQAVDAAPQPQLAGVLEGVPSEPGRYGFVVRVSDSALPADAVSMPLSLTVADLDAIAGRQLEVAGPEEGARVEEPVADGSPGRDYPDQSFTRMVGDAYGNGYVVGYAWDGSRYNIEVLKYAPDGDLLWRRSYDSGNHDYGYGIAVGPGQEVYAVGFSLSGNTYRAAVVKYDAEGRLLWQRHFGFGDGVDTFYAAVAGADGLYLAGESYSGRNFDAQVLKLDPVGEVLWRQLRRSPVNATAYAVQHAGCDEQGCRILVGGAEGVRERAGWVLALAAQDGATLNEVAFAADTAVADLQRVPGGGFYAGGTTPGGDWLLRRFDDDLGVLWTRAYDAGGREGLRGLAVDWQGNLYGAGSRQTDAGRDALVAAFDPTGATLSEYAYGGGAEEGANGLMIDAAQRLRAVGEQRSGQGTRFLYFALEHGRAFVEPVE